MTPTPQSLLQPPLTDLTLFDEPECLASHTRFKLLAQLAIQATASYRQIVTEVDALRSHPDLSPYARQCLEDFSQIIISQAGQLLLKLIQASAVPDHPLYVLSLDQKEKFHGSKTKE